METAFTKERFLEKLHDPGRAEGFRQADWSSEGIVIPGQRVRCADVVERCRPVLEALAPEPAEGWLSCVYAVACRIQFPHLGTCCTEEQWDGAVCCLEAISLYLDREELPFDPMWDFAFCSAEEIHASDRSGEYGRFLAAWREDYIYALMRLSWEATPFSTLSHIAGVHHVAMTVSRELSAAGAPVDPALVSAAAASHDIGKFGCRAGEKVPYLHYYYTDEWCLKRELPSVAHIAANHSTWDLELENLSVESLCLIYADFRVKQDETGAMRIYPLDESFQVILDKLDNVDEKKRLRYEYVYAKLHDFEVYMRRLGVDVTLQGQLTQPQTPRDTALMSPDEAVDELRMMAVEHNLRLMHRFGHERLFGNVLEAARSEKNWTKVRAYVSIFEEYFPYIGDTQKVQTLGFLYELLMFPEGDIRRQAAALIGRIIARFNMGYRKELPIDAPTAPDEELQLELWRQYLEQIAYPDHRLTPWQKRHIRYVLKIVVENVLRECRSQDTARFMGVLVDCYADPRVEDEDAAFALMDALYFLPMEICSETDMAVLLRFTEAQLRRESLTLRAAALRFLLHAAEDGIREVRPIAAAADCGGSWALRYLQNAILGRREVCPPEVASEIFLDNLKSATPWILKDINIRFLETEARGDTLHIATHFSNLIKVSETIAVRYSAGASLLRIAPALSYDQRNEVAVELAKGLEVGQYEFSKYIPQCLGEFCLFLRPAELDETIDRLEQLLSSPNDSVVSASLTTVGVILEHYAVYQRRFSEGEAVVERRRERLAGMLLKGLASYRSAVRQEAMWVFGRGLFGSDELSEADKAKLFTLVAKKFLFLLNEYPGGELTLFYRAAALSHLYRFLIRHQITVGSFPFERREKVAFFPGTFDPFTLSHKGIVRAIRDLGFEVYLAVDEFSWSKKTQPSLIRRQIVSLSVADEFHVQLFPHDVPVNIANPGDLLRLRALFEGRELYLAVGSDVIAGASSYRSAPVEGSVHSLNHIVFRRQSSIHGDFDQPDLTCLTGKVVELQLPTHLEDISSTQIRDNIDLNRDISNLIDPAVQEFIYQNSLYLREPQYKPLMEASALGFELTEHPERSLLEELAEAVGADGYQRSVICRELFDDDDAVMVLRARGQGVLGFASLRQIRVAELYSALGSREQADYVRNHSAGRLLLLTGLYTVDETGEAGQLLLTEVLARALNEECTYALFCPRDGAVTAETMALLQRQGFTRLPDMEGARPAMLVDMRSPVVLLQNMETTIKAPFSTNEAVLRAVRSAHRRLQTAVTGLYPGTLILSLNAQVIHHRLVEKITALNGVPPVPVNPRRLGENMCVPFGKLLRGSAVPNTVTKTIHTDKVYEPDLRSWTIEAFPYYAPLASQVRTVKSFGRPVVLVDDLLHSGDRMGVLAPLLRQEQLPIREVLVGFLSGRGRDLMEIYGWPVDCVYFVPNLRAWFVESSHYPFIGGDTVRREGRPGLVPSINMILPYNYPGFHSQCAKRATFEFSRVCLENARDILTAIESEYRAQFGKNLTLSRLSEAVVLPLCPDKGSCMYYDTALAASVYVENDLAQLMRTRRLFD